MNLSWTMLFSLLIPLLIGIWLDKRLGTVPLFILIGAILGISAATIGVARMTIRTFAKTVSGHDPVVDVTPPAHNPTACGPAARSNRQTETNEKDLS
jgi:hypothetical protein